MPHTPGPWWDESGVIHAKSRTWTPEFHSCVHPGHANQNPEYFEWEEAVANGVLMAAAPDLLEACKRLYNICYVFVVRPVNDLGGDAAVELDPDLCISDLNWAKEVIEAAEEGR